MSWISLDVDIDDILNSLSRADRRELLEALQEDGYIPKELTITDEGEIKLPALMERKKIASSNNEFNQALQKLFDEGWRLTLEQEQYIINLSKRF